MKCPHCHAEVMPVDGELFCLQCGRVVTVPRGSKAGTPALEATTDPVLRKAIMDSLGHPLKWKLPVSGAVPAKAAFASIPRAMAAVRPMVAAPAPAMAAGVQERPVEVEVKHGASSLNLLSNLRKPRRLKVGAKWQLPGLGWVAGMAAAGVFVGLNTGVYAYFAQRAYPGVKVGAIAVGGLTEAQLKSRLQQSYPVPANFDVTVGGSRYILGASGFVSTDTDQAVREAINAGHDVTLPLAGWLEAAWSKPIAVPRVVNQKALNQAMSQLAARVNHEASNPVPMVAGAQAFEINGKPGDELDQSAAANAIESAISKGETTANLPLKQTPPLLGDSAYKDDVSAAQARISLGIKLTIGSAGYNPTAVQLASWEVFKGPGKGVVADPAAVAAYVQSLPGRFDRAGTLGALLGAFNAGQNLNYTASVKKITAVPAVASQPSGVGAVTYSYCTTADSTAELTQLRSQTARELLDPAGWALNGKISFVSATQGCNFSIALVRPQDMAMLDGRCAGQATCMVGNQIEINLSDWNQAPTKWLGGLAAYQLELVGHEVGHWLGFQHAACLAHSAPSSVLQAPVLVLDGCSPNWYPLSVADSTKVLSGFK